MTLSHKDPPCQPPGNRVSIDSDLPAPRVNARRDADPIDRPLPLTGKSRRAADGISARAARPTATACEGSIPVRQNESLWGPFRRDGCPALCPPGGRPCREGTGRALPGQPRKPCPTTCGVLRFPAGSIPDERRDRQMWTLHGGGKRAALPERNLAAPHAVFRALCTSVLMCRIQVRSNLSEGAAGTDRSSIPYTQRRLTRDG